jgi:hypothetical protein
MADLRKWVLIEGEKLSDILARERVFLSRALDITGEVAAGLAHAHARVSFTAT